MGKLARILKHRWHDETDTRRAISPAALARIEQRVADSEKRHSGEIRVCVEAGLPMSYLWRDAPARERAIMMFGKLRVWDTEANNGVLIYLLLADHAIEIVADRGLARHVPTAHWQQIVTDMRGDLARGDFEAGLMRAIDAVEAVLVKHFALADGVHDVNELPNAPTLI